MIKNPIRLIGSGLSSSQALDQDSKKKSSVQDAGLAQANRDWRRAHDLWENVVKDSPNDVDAAIQLGNMKSELENYADAIAVFRGVVHQRPQSFDARAGIAGVLEREGRWMDALQEWEFAITFAALEGDNIKLRHSCIHAIQAAYLGGDRQSIERTYNQATQLCPGLLDTEAGRHLQARLILHERPQEAFKILREILEKEPRNDAVAFDLASLCLEIEEYSLGINAIEQALTLKPNESSFLWLAADLHDRLHHWSEVLAICERLTTLPNVQGRDIRRAFDAAIRLSDIVAARRFARRYARFYDGELELIDRLRNAYERAGEFRSARLLCRWLVKKWSHSHWHLGQLIVLTASTQGLVAADRLVRSFHDRYGRLSIVDRAYCQAAFEAHEYLEAQRRLEWYLKDSDNSKSDTGAHLLLGYVLANAVGIDVAERHFLALASSTYQSEGSLVGIAHMASRRRDRRAEIDLWSKITAMYPDNTSARVEVARAMYNSGDIGRALRLCSHRLNERPSDITMAEFYAWLLLVNARFEDAASYIEELSTRSGPSWTVLEVAVHALGMLKRLDERWTFVEKLLPHDTSRDGANRLYHLTRLLLHFERPDLAARLVARTHLQPRSLAWLVPYVVANRVHVDSVWAEPARMAWDRVNSHVSDRAARRLSTMSDAEIQLAIRKPKHQHSTIHIINKFEQARGGSELHALDLASRLASVANVETWAPEMPHPYFSEHHRVVGIDHSQGRAPDKGVFVFIGVYFPINWLANTRPDRIIFLYNTFEAPMVYDRVAEAYALTGVHPELLFCSQMMGLECGLPGLFEPSPIDIDQFRPALTSDLRPFTLGRHSRDVVEKHHFEDISIYSRVAAKGGRSILLGATCMKSAFGGVTALDLRPAQNNGIVEYLHSLDAFLYRTSTWVEPWGRVVTEAMACQLPVLVHDIGGYAEIIKHEHNGLLFHTTEEAIRLMDRLIDEPKFRRDLGLAARETIEQLLSRSALDRLTMFYIIDGMDNVLAKG